jgi:hypothetical protein
MFRFMMRFKNKNKESRMFCNNCGNAIGEQDKFCKSCGLPNGEPVVQASTSGLCCLNCKGTELQALMANSISGKSQYSASHGCLGFFLFGPIGLLLGADKKWKIATKNTTFWLCKGCGNQFMNPPQLAPLIKETKKNKANDRAFAVLSAVLAIFFGLIFKPILDTNENVIILIVGGLGILLFFCFMSKLAAVVSATKRLKHLQIEYEQHKALNNIYGG